MEPLELPDKPVCMSDKQHDWQIVYTGSLTDCKATWTIISALGWAPEHGLVLHPKG